MNLTIQHKREALTRERYPQERGTHRRLEDGAEVHESEGREESERTIVKCVDERESTRAIARDERIKTGSVNTKMGYGRAMRWGCFGDLILTIDR